MGNYERRLCVVCKREFFRARPRPSKTMCRALGNNIRPCHCVTCCKKCARDRPYVDIKYINRRKRLRNGIK